MKNVTFLTALLLPLLIASEVHGRVSVSATNGGTFYIDDSQGNNQYALTLHATAEDVVTIFTITRTTEDDVILSIDVDSSNPGGNTGLVIGSQNEPLKEVRGISILNDDGFTYIDSMNLSSHFGPATLNGIIFAEIGGNTDKIDVVLNNRGYPFIGEMIVRGDALGDITLEDDGDEVYGNLYALDVRGAIGTPESLVNIAVGGWIVDLKAGEINATITGTAKEGPGSFVGQIFKLESSKIGESSGDIRGEIRCHMTDWPGIEDDVYIRAAGKIEGTIYVGRSLFEKLELMSEITTLEEEGLEGRIIINALNQGGTWTAPVKIGPPTSQIVIDGNGYAEAGGYPN
ncbi:MAG: hypothetical protein JNK58_06260, partial [Phycisphaerae bacterium]|nr:hypothetical protein [Phycisphaerae bacterium]